MEGSGPCLPKEFLHGQWLQGQAVLLLLWLLGCPVCHKSQLAAVKTEYSLDFQPLQLSKAEGENATFVCNVSKKLTTPILNWYREKNGSQPEKLAAYPKDTLSSHLQDRYHIAIRRDNQTYEMTIVGLRLNDSGRYFCGTINFEMPPVEESDRAELSVTERIVVSTTVRPITPSAPPEKLPWIVVVVPAAVGAVLLLLLLCCVLLVVGSRGQGGAGKAESDKDSLSLKKAEPSVTSVSTVVYGQLDFQRTEVPKQGGAGSCEQTEYATIVFSTEKPASYSSSPHRK
ncbi:LOW QUALITY PROTEIN: programmed cell death protein 1 [Dromiciops gliroides]|uniref:LOW QUALITY PROTEIN: programmed cell death protein 1 n=1 Tax=Dromiciops gliroides TaxID=33562 RepID=UPI001CC673FF|nr:LOW QUALITY PROTEIN: programmed cell death protein 1 [Dromiciops gliroides]